MLVLSAVTGHRWSAPLLVRYFEKAGAEWQIAADLRNTVSYRQMNLMGHWSANEHWDIIFMRNVLIYFDLDTKREILARARRQLRPDGYLFLGGAETTLNIHDEFERNPTTAAGCYQLRTAQEDAYAVRQG